jgi:hypothetical protein
VIVRFWTAAILVNPAPIQITRILRILYMYSSWTTYEDIGARWKCLYGVLGVVGNGFFGAVFIYLFCRFVSPRRQGIIVMAFLSWVILQDDV